MAGLAKVFSKLFESGLWDFQFNIFLTPLAQWSSQIFHGFSVALSDSVQLASSEIHLNLVQGHQVGLSLILKFGFCLIFKIILIPLIAGSRRVLLTKGFFGDLVATRAKL